MVSQVADAKETPPILLVILLSALAGGMGWGIRGQYGHETGAMIAGALVGLVLAFFFCAKSSSLFTARAVALMTVAIGFGGSMTYGQTIGLTQDKPLIKNIDALQWGMVGLFIKGGIWIAFAGAFFGIGLSRVRYRSAEMATLLVVMLFLLFLGIALINRPFDPSNKILPAVYFSDRWHWEPNAELTPRPERWGGLLFSLLGLILFTAIKRDKLALLLALFGFLAGGFGFTIGQSLQSYHAWNREFFEAIENEFLAKIIPNINWWNMMETTFGAIFGAILALGLWLNRDLIQGTAKDQNDQNVNSKNEFDQNEKDQNEFDQNEKVELSPISEWLLAIVHIAAVIVWNFGNNSTLDLFADHAITMGMIPILGIVAGRLWPYLLVLPIVILPIAGKTIRELIYKEPRIEELLFVLTKPLSLLPNGADLQTRFIQSISENPQILQAFGWFFYGILPVGLAFALAIILQRKSKSQSGRAFARAGLLFSAWIYFCLNFAFFHFPWAWKALDQWTNRTPNAILFAVSLLVITLVTLVYGKCQVKNFSQKPNRQMIMKLDAN